jgi:hypothetical protein
MALNEERTLASLSDQFLARVTLAVAKGPGATRAMVERIEHNLKIHAATLPADKKADMEKLLVWLRANC